MIRWLGKLIEEWYLSSWVAEDYGPERASPAHWWRRAAELGDPWGASHLARAYEEGIEVPQDAAQALHWYQRAADGGDEFADAMRKVGLAFLHGRGVSQDQDQALMWLQKAEAAGDSEAIQAIEHLRSTPLRPSTDLSPNEAGIETDRTIGCALPTEALLEALRRERKERLARGARLDPPAFDSPLAVPPYCLKCGEYRRTRSPRCLCDPEDNSPRKHKAYQAAVLSWQSTKKWVNGIFAIFTLMALGSGGPVGAVLSVVLWLLAIHGVDSSKPDESDF